MREHLILRYGTYTINRKNDAYILRNNHPQAARPDGTVPLDFTSSGLYVYGLEQRPVNFETTLSTPQARGLIALASALAENTDLHSPTDRKDPESLQKQPIYTPFSFDTVNGFITDENNPLCTALRDIEARLTNRTH